jgi:hypothetical protein
MSDRLSFVHFSEHVCAILCGHVHRRFAGQNGGSPVLITPSTCCQFVEAAHGQAISDDTPMLRLVTCRGPEMSSALVRV